MLADGGGLVVLGTGTEAVLRDTLHLVQEMIPELKEALLLAVKEREGLGIPGQAVLNPRAVGIIILEDRLGLGLADFAGNFG